MLVTTPQRFLFQSRWRKQNEGYWVTWKTAVVMVIDDVDLFDELDGRRQHRQHVSNGCETCWVQSAASAWLQTKATDHRARSFQCASEESPRCGLIKSL